MVEIWFVVLGWTFTFVTVLGNGLVAHLILTRPRLHTTANFFILSLSLADFCVGATYFPLLFVSNFYDELAIDHTGVWFKVSHSFLYASSANLCVMTTDRFLAISKPLKYSSYMTRARRAFLLSAAWTSPLILFTLPSVFTYSSGNEKLTLFFETFRVLIFQLVPSVMFMFVTVRLCHIAREISRKDSVLTAQIGFNHPSVKFIKHNKHPEKKACMKMVVAIISLFILCHIGGNYRCFCFVFEICVVPETLKKVIHLVFIVNSAGNPFAYAVLKRDMKKELRRMLFH